MSEETTEDNPLANDPIHDVLRDILAESEDPLTMDEIQDHLDSRLQKAIRGLNHTGELESGEVEERVINRTYDISEEK